MPDWLSFIDIAVALILFLFALGGYHKGFAGQIAHILTFVGAGVFLFFGYPYIYDFLRGVFRNTQEAYISWLLVAALIALAVGLFVLVNKLLSRLIKMHLSDSADHVNGFIFGFVRGVLTVLVVLILYVIIGSEQAYQALDAKSRAGRFVCRKCMPRIQPHLNESVLDEKVQRVRNKLMQREEGGKLE